MRDLQNRRFWSKLAINGFAAVGLLSACVGITDATFPDVLPPVGGWTIAVIGAVALGFALVRSWPRPVEEQFSSPNMSVKIVVGDIFEQPGNLAIGFSTTFDTEMPNVIAPRSLQGQLVAREFANDLSLLEDQLSKELSGRPSDHTFSVADVKQGKQLSYPLGTTIAVTSRPRRLIFCVAYTEMRADCTTHGTVDGIWKSLHALWQVVDRKGNGDPISIGVIGGGQARISQHFPAHDSIRLIAMSYVFASRVQKISQELRIVVRPEDVAQLDMLELQAFLSSLR